MMDLPYISIIDHSSFFQLYSSSPRFIMSSKHLLTNVFLSLAVHETLPSLCPRSQQYTLPQQDVVPNEEVGSCVPSRKPNSLSSPLPFSVLALYPKSLLAGVVDASVVKRDRGVKTLRASFDGEKVCKVSIVLLRYEVSDDYVQHTDIILLFSALLAGDLEPSRFTWSLFLRSLDLRRSRE
jgi:hypothetical protein